MWTRFGLLLVLTCGSLPFGAGAQVSDLATAPEWETLSEITEAARAGDPAAEFLMGQLHESGRLVDRDLAAAMRWYRRAAEQGYALAQFSVGALYDFGEGIQQDFGQAIEWYEKAALQGLALAQHNLGNLYADGMGVARDPDAAIYWFRKAAEQGFVEAQYNLGYMYASGEGVPVDFVEAYFWWRMAATQGDSTAQRNLERLVERLDPDALAQLQAVTNERMSALMRTQGSSGNDAILESTSERDSAGLQGPTGRTSGTAADTDAQVDTNAGVADVDADSEGTGSATADARGAAPPANGDLLLDTVARWAGAWSAQDVDAYLAAYAPDFQPANNQSRDAWERLRRERVTAPRFIRVEVSDPRIEYVNDERVTVTFRQRYESDRFTSEDLKQLELVPVDGAWLIRSERVLD